MRLYADIEIVNRALACHNMKGKGKRVKSHLAIGKKPLSEGRQEIFIMVTNSQNKAGCKYLIQNNISAVFTKLVNEGKTTIRLKEPEHDICIKGDVIEVKSFLSVLKKVLSGQDVEKLPLSALQPLSSKQLSGPKRKLVVTKRSEYPVKEGFPQTLVEVCITNIRLAKIDGRILKLVNLTELDLSSNEIENIPDNFDALHSLTQLNLANNRISNISRGFCTGRLSRTLRLLDLSGNSIKLLPNCICKLEQLVTLKVSSNQLTLLPPSIGRLGKLKHLSADSNLINVLPGSFVALRLDCLELSHNPFSETTARVLVNKLEPVSSLLEASARTVVARRVHYTPEDLFPQLLAYLDSVMHCPCSTPVWNNVARALVKLQLSRVSSTVSCDGLTEVCVDASLCSHKCLNLFQNNPFAF